MPAAPPQHQVLGILVPGRGALLGKGQEGIIRGDVEQSRDAVGDSTCLSEQRLRRENMRGSWWWWQWGGALPTVPLLLEGWESQM